MERLLPRTAVPGALSSVMRAEYLFRRSILPEIGELRCSDLKAEHLRVVLRKLAGTGLSYESVSIERIRPGHPQDRQQSNMFSYLSPEQRVRKDHPLRAIRAMADQALDNMSKRFDAMYAKIGRPSIPPEKLLRAQLIQMLYSVRSERMLVCLEKSLFASR